MTEKSRNMLGLKKCSCDKSNLKIIADGQRSIVACVGCGKRTNSCNSEEHAIFCWNNGFVFKIRGEDMTRLQNGFYSFSDSYLKSMRKQDLINYIRTIEKNWENQLITNDIQRSNCKRLLAEEHNKTITEFAKRLNSKISDFVLEHKDNLDFASGISAAWNIVDEVEKEMRCAEC